MRDARRGGGGARARGRAAVAIAETGDDRRPARRRLASSAGVREAAGCPRGTGGADFTRSIMTTDRGPEGVHAAGRRRHGLGPGQGRGDDRAGLRDDALLRPDRRRGRRSRRRAARRRWPGSMERITVDGQMSTNDTVVLQATGDAGEPLPDGLLDAVLLQLALEIVADGEGATRVGQGRGERGPRSGGGRAGRPRDRQLAAGQDRAVRPRPELGPDRPGRRAWRWPARSCHELGARRHRRTELGADDSRGRAVGRRSARGDSRAHLYFSDLTYDYVRINAEYTT